MKLEVVVVPVADVDRAKNFYKALGWREDADFVTGADEGVKCRSRTYHQNRRA
jgi:catechol 2,3-dioxygenase-like lactoylglutathione lyase family enzyme